LRSMGSESSTRAMWRLIATRSPSTQRQAHHRGLRRGRASRWQRLAPSNRSQDRASPDTRASRPGRRGVEPTLGSTEDLLLTK
jgi:hypothetical protein